MNFRKLEKEVPFDQFSRQYQVAEIIRTLKGSGESLTVLDVGGYRGRTSDFLASDKVTVVDLFDVIEDGYVQGSALDLPFETSSFDFVASFDVLEHIPAEHRETFIAECSRVAKKGIIICAPNKTPLNELTEKNLNELYKRLHRKPHRWLKEHIDYGIPSFDWVDQKVQKKGLHTTRFFSNKTQLWFAMQRAIFTNSKFPLAAEHLTKLNEYYNLHFKYDGGGSEESSYRQILCGLRDEKAAALLREKMSNLNKPIDPMLEHELTEKIHDYYITLLTKTTQLAKNYSELYEFHKNVAETYERDNLRLKERVHKYEKLIPTKLLARTRRKPHGTIE